jgi:tRNA U55 pseudouridine synthase TruB
MIHNLYKQRGETPLERIRRFVKSNPEFKGQKMTYLGRLDPLAEGVLLVASGEDVKRKEEFLGLDKEYDFISIFGFATDTYDVLGKVVRVEKLDRLEEVNLLKVANIYEGERDQKYPEYSSKVRGWGKTSPRASSGVSCLPSPDQGKGTLRQYEEGGCKPGGVFKKITIHKVQFHKLDTLSNKELFGRLLMDISKVQGDFRQSEILILWKQILLGSEPSPLKGEGDAKRGVRYLLGHFSAHVSAGTYIRSLVSDMGNTLGCGATTLSIKRNRVGDFKIEDSLK